jgi:hypothetical protein
MKSTKIMLAIIATFLITWFVMGLIEHLLSNASYNECMINDVTIMLMMIFGWIPAVIIGHNLNEHLKD